MPFALHHTQLATNSKRNEMLLAVWENNHWLTLSASCVAICCQMKERSEWKQSWRNIRNRVLLNPMFCYPLYLASLSAHICSSSIERYSTKLNSTRIVCDTKLCSSEVSLWIGFYIFVSRLYPTWRIIAAVLKLTDHLSAKSGNKLRHPKCRLIRLSVCLSSQKWSLLQPIEFVCFTWGSSKNTWASRLWGAASTHEFWQILALIEKR